MFTNKTKHALEFTKMHNMTYMKLQQGTESAYSLESCNLLVLSPAKERLHMHAAANESSTKETYALVTLYTLPPWWCASAVQPFQYSVIGSDRTSLLPCCRSQWRWSLGETAINAEIPEILLLHAGMQCGICQGSCNPSRSVLWPPSAGRPNLQIRVNLQCLQHEVWDSGAIIPQTIFRKDGLVLCTKSSSQYEKYHMEGEFLQWLYLVLTPGNLACTKN